MLRVLKTSVTIKDGTDASHACSLLVQPIYTSSNVQFWPMALMEVLRDWTLHIVKAFCVNWFMYLRQQTELTILVLKIKLTQLSKWKGLVFFTGRSLRQCAQTVTGSFSHIQPVIGGGAGGEKEGSHLGFLIFAWQDTLSVCIPLTKAFHLPWQTWIQVRLSAQWIFNDSPGNYGARKKKKNPNKNWVTGSLWKESWIWWLIHMIKFELCWHNKAAYCSHESQIYFLVTLKSVVGPWTSIHTFGEISLFKESLFSSVISLTYSLLALYTVKLYVPCQ